MPAAGEHQPHSRFASRPEVSVDRDRSPRSAFTSILRCPVDGAIGQAVAEQCLRLGGRVGPAQGRRLGRQQRRVARAQSRHLAVLDDPGARWRRPSRRRAPARCRTTPPRAQTAVLGPKCSAVPHPPEIARRIGMPALRRARWNQAAAACGSAVTPASPVRDRRCRGCCSRTGSPRPADLLQVAQAPRRIGEQASPGRGSNSQARSSRRCARAPAPANSSSQPLPRRAALGPVPWRSSCLPSA